jgi:surface protein
MFTGCSALQSVPLFNTAAVANMQSMFSSCISLVNAPALNTSAVTSGNFSGMFSGCSSLSAAPLSGTNQNISYAACKLSPAALNAIYTGLSATGSGKTITVTGNWGTASHTPSIATAKGWTVTV